VKGRGVPSGYVEGLNDARTLLVGVFSILKSPSYVKRHHHAKTSR
jgi:hypothetical protein